MVNTGAPGTRVNPPVGSFDPSSERPCPRKSGTMARIPASSCVSGRQYSRSRGVGCSSTTGRPSPASLNPKRAPPERYSPGTETYSPFISVPLTLVPLTPVEDTPRDSVPHPVRYTILDSVPNTDLDSDLDANRGTEPDKAPYPPEYRSTPPRTPRLSVRSKRRIRSP